MRKYVRCSFALSDEWYDSDEVNELLPKCNARERRLFGKLRNSTDPVVYLHGIIDATNLLGCNASDEFIDLVNNALANIHVRKE